MLILTNIKQQVNNANVVCPMWCVNVVKAFDAIFDEYYPKILRYAFLRTANAAVAADIASETFYKALKNLWKFSFTGVSVLAWLYRIAGNLVIDHFRGEKRRPLSMDAYVQNGLMPQVASLRDLEAEIMEEQARLDANPDYKLVAGYLKSLPDKYQEVIVLRYMEGKSIEETCAILGKKTGTVKSLASRAVAMLRKKMQP